MKGIVSKIVDAMTGKQDEEEPKKQPVEDMEDPIGNPTRPLTMGEIHKIGKKKVAKPY